MTLTAFVPAIRLDSVQNGGWSVDAAGFTVSRPVGYETYTRLLASAVMAGGTINWIVGDILNAAENELGEEWVQITVDIADLLENNGWAKQRIANCKWVSRSWPKALRSAPQMSWTHHAHLAAHPDRRGMLILAESEGWSSRQLYNFLRGLKEGVPAILPQGNTQPPHSSMYPEAENDFFGDSSEPVPVNSADVVAETIYRIVRLGPNGRELLHECTNMDEFNYWFERYRFGGQK